MSILVSIALATICFTYNGKQECDPVLLGKNNTTPRGDFVIRRRFVVSPGYGGDVLQFYEDKVQFFAIHRIWLLRPQEHRQERLKSSNVKEHFISSGCINVSPDVYEKLVNCCQNQELEIF